jgi:hypothetical protein
LRLNSNHPGIRKNLGYSLVWMARYNQAYLLSQDIPEARDELETYVWWWQNQGRKDLAGRAGQMARLLEGKGQISPETIYKTNP